MSGAEHAAGAGTLAVFAPRHSLVIGGEDGTPMQVPPGTVVEIEAAEARDLIGRGIAELHADTPPLTSGPAGAPRVSRAAGPRVQRG